MKLLDTTPRPPRVEKACSREQARPVMLTPHFEAEAGELQATNSYMAARVPVLVEEDDTSGPVPVEAVKALAGGIIGVASLVLDEQVAFHPGGRLPEQPAAITFARPDNGTWPKLADGKVWPTRDVIADAPFRVGLSAKFLYELATALGCDSQLEVELVFPAYLTPDGTREPQPNPLRPIIVLPLRRSGEGIDADEPEKRSPEGLLMPVRVR